jgi:ribosomal-protein-alanine N-acetyltransferase
MSQLIPFTIMPMTPADIPAVIAVEHASYSMTWPARAYDYEVQKNDLAYYFVLRTRYTARPNFDAGNGVSGSDQSWVSNPASQVIGMAGFWLMAAEIHINTIAVYPDWRGLGLGEWLLLTLIQAGRDLGGTLATLEVRPSNQSALGLYQKYQFEQVGRRRRYYADNDEDALILTTPPLTAPAYQAMLAQHQAALFKRLAYE